MSFQRRNMMAFLAIFLFIFALGFNSGCKGKKEGAAVEAGKLEKLPDIQERLAKYAPTELGFDKNLLNEEQTQVLKKLILAAEYMDKSSGHRPTLRGLR